MNPRRAAALLALATLALPAAAAELVGEDAPPRFYGYVLGDLVTRRIALDAPAAERLAESSVPAPGRANRYFELVRVGRATAPAARGATRYRLELVYQVIGVDPEIRIVELPAFALNFTAGKAVQAVDVPALSLSVGPVAPQNAFVETLGDVPAQPADTAPARRLTLAAGAIAALIAAAWAAWRYLLPYLKPSSRPFHVAWRRLRHLRRFGTVGGTDYALALRALHGAFNATFGQTLLPEALPAFFGAHPAFRRLERDIADFFARSHDHLFGGRRFAEGDAGWPELLALAHRLSRAERR
jgi:mxaA protein